MFSDILQTQMVIKIFGVTSFYSSFRKSIFFIAMDQSINYCLNFKP